ncbi:helix-turn-helix domain-containing protein [Mycobacteroides abscessus]|nr:helix-turn-helix domain-containing protein [Mycobacteroides abscessus]MDM2178621.1 helix-turn-helix domain-containing protein [Mycobacteroides abscessus]MDM2211649.1 helix-turn-helix domain-containing protein [Mycobacteroides abscessus]MDM2217537.1 helix-turn-helix domain-containing protein [Mycobacteroides abscessus]MDM2221986.1 helix-turn-helix domain-containing protein [Mycobacteroides abscessus]
MTPEQRRDWRDYVLGAKTLTLAQRIVLLALETFADYADGTNARPGIEGLRRKCGLTERAVETALKRGRELGLIQRTANGFKRHAAVYRLVPIANTPHGGAGQNGDTPHGRAGQNSQSPHSGAGQRSDSPHGGASLTRTAVPPTTSGPHQKRGLRHGGTELGDPDAYAINPASGLRQSANGNAAGTRCAKHAHIPDDEWMPENCRDCGARRKATKAFQADRKSAAIQTIKDCPHCDDLGRVEIVSAGVEQLAPCPRHVSWAQAQEGRTA